MLGKLLLYIIFQIHKLIKNTLKCILFDLIRCSDIVDANQVDISPEAAVVFIGRKA